MVVFYKYYVVTTHVFVRKNKYFNFILDLWIEVFVKEENYYEEYGLTYKNPTFV